MRSASLQSRPARRRPLWLAAALFLLSASAAGDQVEKQVFLVSRDNQLIAANIRFNRIDSLEMRARERLIATETGAAVAVAATNQRYVAYSVDTASWQELRVQASESLVGLEAEDYSAVVVTSRRVLSFNGRTGTWAELRRRVDGL